MSIQMLSDEELLGRIRSACRQKRLHLNMTQSEMAGRAGLSSEVETFLQRKFLN